MLGLKEIQAIDMLIELLQNYSITDTFSALRRWTWELKSSWPLVL